MVTPGGEVREEAISRIVKARAALAKLLHLWNRLNIRLFLKWKVYSAIVRGDLLYICETWPIHNETARRFSVPEALLESGGNIG